MKNLKTLIFSCFHGKATLLFIISLLCLSATRVSGCFYLLFLALILLFKESGLVPWADALHLFGQFLKRSAGGFFLVFYLLSVSICSILSLVANKGLLSQALSSFHPSLFHILLSAISCTLVLFSVFFVGSLSTLELARFSLARNVVVILLLWSLSAFAFSGLTLIGSSHEPASNLRPTEGLYITSFVLYFYLRVFSRIKFLSMSSWGEFTADVLPGLLAALVVASFGGIGAWCVLLLWLCRLQSRFNLAQSDLPSHWSRNRVVLLLCISSLLLVALSLLLDPVRYLIVKYFAYLVGFPETPRFSYIASFADYVVRFPPSWFGASSASWNDVLSHNTFLDISIRYGVVPSVSLFLSLLSSASNMIRLSLLPRSLFLPVDLVGLVIFFCYLLLQPVPLSDSYSYVLMVSILSLTSALCAFLRATSSEYSLH